jgi:hypothetical protein
VLRAGVSQIPDEITAFDGLSFYNRWFLQMSKQGLISRLPDD